MHFIKIRSHLISSRSKATVACDSDCAHVRDRARDETFCIFESPARMVNVVHLSVSPWVIYYAKRATHINYRPIGIVGCNAAGVICPKSMHGV